MCKITCKPKQFNHRGDTKFKKSVGQMMIDFASITRQLDYGKRSLGNKTTYFSIFMSEGRGGHMLDRHYQILKYAHTVPTIHTVHLTLLGSGVSYPLTSHVHICVLACRCNIKRNSCQHVC